MRRVALVSGGSRGIGAAIVRRFASHDMDVAFTFLHEEDRAQTLASAMASEHGVQVLALRCDVRESAQARAAVDEAQSRLGALDVVVNNAGVARDQNLVSMTDREWHDVIDTNVNGAFHLTRAAVGTLLRRRQGTIVNVSSVAGMVGLAGMTNYATSKAALLGFTRSLAKECAPRGVTVNAVAPGFIETDMLGNLRPEYRDQMRAAVPLKRFGTADEVAALVHFLTTDDARYITGQVFVTDGGLSL